MLGKIHSIETFGTVDGPGIRFVIFMQGCHLQCKYCHNRDTWNLNSGNVIEMEDLLKQILDFHTAIDTSRDVHP